MDAKLFIDALLKAKVSFFTGVPDSYLHGFCTELSNSCAPDRNVATANEGNAVGIAVGHHLATGEIPLVYMQNSGLGNAVNPLVSLACRGMLCIPMVLLIGWRGDPFHKDHVQHELQGAITPAMLDEMKIPYTVIADGDAGIEDLVADTVFSAMRDGGGPAAILVPKGVLSGAKTPIVDTSLPVSREGAIRIVLDAAPRNSIYSATTGRAARELFHLREARGEGHACDYLNVGSMGHASSVAFGLALAMPERQVICLDGDAAAIMHMGALTMVSQYDAPNFLHVVLNNGMHESVGGQSSAGRRIDLTSIASACGYEVVNGPVSSEDAIKQAIIELCGRDGAGFLDIQIKAGLRPDIPGLEIDPVFMKEEIMQEAGSLDRWHALCRKDG